MNTSFSTELPTLQIAWDSTSLSALLECPRKYQLSHIQGWSPRLESVHLTFGILYHGAIERYDHAKASGATHSEAIVAAVRWTLTETWNKELRRPWTSDDKHKNRLTLIRSIVWYLTQFAEDTLETVILSNNKPAVELSFRFDSDISFGSTRYVLCGHLDRVAKFQDLLWINDHKTTKSSIEGDDYFARYSPDNQMSMYAFAGKVIYNVPVQGVIVNAAQVMVTFTRFRRGFAHRTEAQLSEWYEHTKFYIKQAEKFATANFWPMNIKSCGLYGGCPFRSICGKDPSVREQWLQAGFKKRVWDPLKIRGDI